MGANILKYLCYFLLLLLILFIDWNKNQFSVKVLMQLKL